MPEVDPEEEVTEVQEPTWVSDGPTQAEPTRAAEQPRGGFAWSAETEVDSERGVWSAVAVKLLAPALAVTLGAAAATLAFMFTSHRGNPPSHAPETTAPSVASPTSQPSPTSEPVAAAPSLDGTYRIDFDHQAFMPAMSTYYGFRSACTSTGCVATGTMLDWNNLAAPNYRRSDIVLHWSTAAWVSDELRDQATCDSTTVPGKPAGWKGTFIRIDRFSLVPQRDGTYSGTKAVTVPVNECNVALTPGTLSFTAWRTGPAPTGVVPAPPTGR